MKRSALSPGTKPLKPISDKTLAERLASGERPTSTFRRKLRQISLPGSGVSVSRSADGGAVGVPLSFPRPRAVFSPFLRGPAAVIRERSGGWCELYLEGCWGRATDKSHRVGRQIGGRRGEARLRSDRPSNALDSCRRCHDEVTEHPAWAKEFLHGWVLEDWQEPLQYPVLYRGKRLVYLDDAGKILDFEKAGA